MSDETAINFLTKFHYSCSVAHSTVVNAAWTDVSDDEIRGRDFEHLRQLHWVSIWVSTNPLKYPTDLMATKLFSVFSPLVRSGREMGGDAD